jgi:hypothetical protein
MAVKILYFSWEASYYDTEDMLKNTGVEYKKITGSVGDVEQLKEYIKLPDDN